MSTGAGGGCWHGRDGRRRQRRSWRRAEPTGTPVEENGKLSVEGKELKNESGNVVQLKGLSSMWLHWEEDGYAESKSALQWLRDNWKIDSVRAAMGVEPEGAYLEDPGKAKRVSSRRWFRTPSISGST